MPEPPYTGNPTEVDFDLPVGLPADASVTFDANRTVRSDEALEADAEQATRIIKEVNPTLVQTRRLAEETAQQKAPSKADLEEQGRPEPTTGANFLLRQRIGSGGFGDVWEAVQTSLGRVIAVKTIREEVRERNPLGAKAADLEFCREALIAASLDHPSIVPIYDFAVDERGNRLLAMKFAHGTSWAKLLQTERQKLPFIEYLNRHLAILVDVCQAVAFAHAKGIVHRDIKPGQVVIGEYGEVYLMDWGLAIVYDKEIVDDAHSPILTTGLLPTCDTASNPSGTICFMAPEQTDGTAGRIGPWTDVYLLGGTLYNILTAKTPHDMTDVRKGFFQARMGEVRPLADAAEGRTLPGELVAICEKALANETTARYASAREFLEAIQDYLSGAGRRREALELVDRAASALGSASDYGAFSNSLELIERAASNWKECPGLEDLRARARADFARLAITNGDLVLADSQVARLPAGDERDELGRFVDERRARLRTIRRQRRLFLKSTVIVLAALVVGTILYIDAQVRSRALLEAANTSLANERDQAEDLMQLMLFDLREQLQPLGRLDLLAEVARKSEGYYAARAAEEGPVAPDALRRRTAAWMNIGDVFRGQGNLTGSLEAYEQAETLASELIAADGSDENLQLHTDTREQVALIEQNLGNLQKAIGLLEACLPERARLAVLGETAVAKHGKTLLHLGTALDRAGRREAALARMEEAAEVLGALAEQHPDTALRQNDYAAALDQLALVHEAGGDLTTARELWLRAHAVMERLATREPDNTWWKRDLALSFERLAAIDRRLGDDDAARDAVTKALAIRADLVRRDPTNAWWKNNYAQSLMSLADLEMAGERQSAVARLREARDVLAPLHEADPGDARWAFSLALCLNRLGRVNIDDGNINAAEEDYRAAADLLAELVERDPESFAYARECHVARERLAEVLDAKGEYPAAIELLGAVAEGRRLLHQKDPSNVAMLHDLAAAINHRALLLQYVGQPRGTVEGLKEAVALFAEASAGAPLNRGYAADHAQSLLNLGLMLDAFGESDEGIARLNESEAILARITAEEPGNGGWLELLSAVRDNLGNVLLAAGRPAEARAAYAADLDFQRGRLARAPDNPDAINRTAWNLVQLARIAGELGEQEVAARHTIEAADAVAPLLTRLEGLPDYMLDTAAVALLKAGRVEQAAPVAALLRTRGALAGEALELAQQQGLDSPAEP